VSVICLAGNMGCAAGDVPLSVVLNMKRIKNCRRGSRTRILEGEAAECCNMAKSQDTDTPTIWPVKRDADAKRSGQAMERTNEDKVIRDKSNGAAWNADKAHRA
jgi:hypothetical protein